MANKKEMNVFLSILESPFTRQLNVMDETYVINQLKEDTCMVSTDFNRDMAMTQKKGKDNPFVVDYVLPDFTTIRRGYVRPKDEAGSGEQVPTYLLLSLVFTFSCSTDVYFSPWHRLSE